MTKEYRIDVKVRNNIILYKMEQAGYTSINEFCKLNNLSNVGGLGGIINMKRSPINKDGRFSNIIEQTAQILGCSPEDLFSDVQLHTVLETNKHHIAVNEAEMKFMLETDNQHKLLENIVLDDQCSKAVEKQLNTLTPREQKVINMRFALGDYSKEHTFEEISIELDVTKERIRQIECKALRKLRHPDRAESLKEFLDERRKK